MRPSARRARCEPEARVVVAQPSVFARQDTTVLTTRPLGTPGQARPAGRLLAQVLEVAELALDLGLDVERLLAPPGAALVTGDDELADLLDQRAVSREATALGLGEQPLELGLDIERLLAAGALPVGLGLEHLADLGLLRGARDRRRGAPARRRELAVDAEL